MAYLPMVAACLRDAYLLLAFFRSRSALAHA
jgi:hypothetical protein